MTVQTHLGLPQHKWDVDANKSTGSLFFFWTYCCGLKQHGEPLLFNMQHKSRDVSLPTSWAEGGRRAAKTREPVRRAGWRLNYNPGRQADGWRERKTGAQTKQPAKEIKQAPDPGCFTQIKFILRRFLDHRQNACSSATRSCMPFSE